MKYSQLNIDQKINYKHNLQSRSKIIGQPKGWFLMGCPTIRKSIGEVYAYDDKRNYVHLDASNRRLPSALSFVRG